MTPFDPKTTFESWGNFSIGKLQAPLGIARVDDLLKLSLQKMQTNTESTLRIRVHFAHFNRNSPNFRIFVLIPEYAFIMGRRFTTDLVGIYRYLWLFHLYASLFIYPSD